MAAVEVPAEGCPEAEEVVGPVPPAGMSPMARLRRLPKAFEACACRGDMDTLAALYWFMIMDDMVPIRWHPWDDAVVAELGDDASYGELAKVLSERYRAAQKK